MWNDFLSNILKIQAFDKKIWWFYGNWVLSFSTVKSTKNKKIYHVVFGNIQPTLVFSFIFKVWKCVVWALESNQQICSKQLENQFNHKAYVWKHKMAEFFLVVWKSFIFARNKLTFHGPNQTLYAIFRYSDLVCIFNVISFVMRSNNQKMLKVWR